MENLGESSTVHDKPSWLNPVLDLSRQPSASNEDINVVA